MFVSFDYGVLYFVKYVLGGVMIEEPMGLSLEVIVKEYHPFIVEDEYRVRVVWCGKIIKKKPLK